VKVGESQMKKIFFITDFRAVDPFPQNSAISGRQK
jgi:hypothetical protein